MSEVLDGVVSVLVQCAQQLLQAFLNPVRVGRALVESIGEASHGDLLLVVDLRDNSLLVHSLQLPLLCHGLLLECLDSLLEPFRHLFLEVLCALSILLSHLLVLLLQV